MFPVGINLFVVVFML